MIESNAATATPPLVINASVSFGGVGDLQESLGIKQTSDAIGNLLGTSFGDVVKRVIGDSPMPEFMKDAAFEAIDTAVKDSSAPVSAQAEAETAEQMQDVIDQMMEDAFAEMSEATEKTGEEGGGKASANGGGGGNWLAEIAKALGSIAGKHLENSVELAREITAESSGGASPGEMAELTAEMQAETQMFKMAQEAATTIVKSVGEALQTTARKQ